MTTTTIILLTGGAIFALILICTLVLFFRGGGQKPLTYERRQFGIITAALLRLSGHHPLEFERLHPAVAWRFAACGLSVVVPPLLAFFGILLACHVFNTGGGFGWAAAAGLFILLLDFLLVAALGGGKSEKAGWILAAYRGLLALGIGWFIARPAILLAYGEAIDGLNRKNRWEEIRKTTEDREKLKRESVAAHQPMAEHYATRRALLEAELRTVIASKGPVNLRIIDLEKERADEDLTGLNGSKPGRGDQFEKRVEYLNEQKDKIGKIEKEEARLEKELAELTKAHEEQLGKATDDPAFKALGEAAATQITELGKSKAGWSEREDLMMRWVMADPLKRLPGLVLIHGTLLLLDLLPLITLLFVDREELDQNRRREKAKVSAEVAAYEKAAADGAEATVRERILRDQLRERSATQKETSDLRLDHALHNILRHEQAMASGRPAFFKLRFGSSKPKPEQEVEWEAAWQEASKPLQKAMERNLHDFDNLVG